MVNRSRNGDWESRNQLSDIELLELATEVQEVTLSRAKLGNPPIEDEEDGTIFVSETEDETRHVHLVGHTKTVNGKTDTTEYIWDTKNLGKERVKCTRQSRGNGNGQEIVFGTDISESFSSEDKIKIKDLLSKFTNAFTAEDLLGAEMGIDDPWVNQELERGLTGDGLSVSEWISLQTYLMDKFGIDDRRVAQALLEQNLIKLARG